MSNRLLDLENSLVVPSARRIRRPHAARAVPVVAGPEKASRKAREKAPGHSAYGSAAPTSRTSGFARAASAVNYRVPGSVMPLAQPNSMACWATVATMMISWRKQVSMSIPSALTPAGKKWVDTFTANTGLAGSEKAPFLAAVGLVSELPQSLSPAGWEQLLKRYGPLWVTTDEDPSAGFAIHARILTGIIGDGTGVGTTLDIVDPAGGTAYQESFDTFVRKFESEALAGKPLRVQIVHWPHDIGYEVTKLVRTKSAAYALGLSVGRFVTVDEDEFEPAYKEEAAEHVVTRATSAFAFGLKPPPAMTATDVRWARDADSADYRHLAAPIDTAPFTLTGAIVKRLATCNRFTFDGMDEKVVFGLRGCTLDAPIAQFADAISVHEIEPNHIDNRCVIGVWDRTTGKLVAFPASTVPNWEYMERYRQNHARKANQQPTGCYALTVGTHRPKSKNRIQGALRNAAKIVVLRSEDDLTYTTRDTWDETTPYDNLHPGIIAVNTGQSTTPDYSSAGCSTIPGTQPNDEPAGTWKQFRAALGLNNTNPTRDDGHKFAYLLLTGREARLATLSAPLDRLRFGSRGPEVRQLQEAMAKLPGKYFTGSPDAIFGSSTAMALIKLQKDRDAGAADGIVSPRDAAQLGVALSTATVKQLGIGDIIGDLARGIWKAITKRAEEGRFSVTSDLAEFMHDDTASTRQWTRKTATFTLKGTVPGSGLKDLGRADPALAHEKLFKFMLDFEYNGYDVKNAQVTRVSQGSSEMTRGQFNAIFKAKNATTVGAEVARIELVLTGKWDPGLGDKTFDVTGKAFVEADGDIGFDLDKNERVSINFFAGGTFSGVQTTPGKAPASVKRATSVFFSPPGSDKVSEKEMSAVKKWIAALRGDDVRYRRLRAGKIEINVEGHASATGKGQLNQDLSRRRAKKIVDLLRDELGSEAKIIVAAHGEDDPAQKLEKEEEHLRRVDIWFEVAGVN